MGRNVYNFACHLRIADNSCWHWFCGSGSSVIDPVCDLGRPAVSHYDGSWTLSHRHIKTAQALGAFADTHRLSGWNDSGAHHAYCSGCDCVVHHVPQRKYSVSKFLALAVQLRVPRASV